MQGYAIGRKVRLYMIFYACVLVQFPGAQSGKGPFPFYIKVALFSITATTYLAVKFSAVGLNGKYFIFKNYIGNLAFFHYLHRGCNG